MLPELSNFVSPPAKPGVYLKEITFDNVEDKSKWNTRFSYDAVYIHYCFVLSPFHESLEFSH